MLICEGCVSDCWCGVAVTEGKGFCRRRQERRAQEQLERDLANLDKVVVIESRGKRRKR